MSSATVWDCPLWEWRQHVAWQDAHIEAYKKAKEANCVNC